MPAIPSVRRTALAGAVLLVLAGVAATAGPASATQYGSHDVHGIIEREYLERGGPSGFLGLPLTDELATPVLYGAYNHFQGGSIYWDGYDAHEVHGAIRDLWAQLGWEQSPLHFPISEEYAATGVGRRSDFQGGSILWTPTTGAHEVVGAIFALYVRLGADASTLGFPISGEYAVPGGRRSDFEHGSVTWTPAGGASAAIDVPTPTGPSAPVPAGTTVVTGGGTGTVTVPASTTPVLLHLHTTRATAAEFLVTSHASTGDLADMRAGDDAVVWLNPAVRGSGPTRSLSVLSDTTWELDLIPLAATATFGKGVTIGESRSTVWRYVGPDGTARITDTSGPGRNSNMMVLAHDPTTGVVDLLYLSSYPKDLWVPVHSGDYLEVSTNALLGEFDPLELGAEGSWAITVV